MRLLLQNISSDALSYVNGEVAIPASLTQEIMDVYWLRLYADPQFLIDLRNSNLILSDGATSYRYPASEDYMKFLLGNIQSDTEGSSIVRMKAAKKGWSFWALPIEFTTSTIDGTLYAKNVAGVDIPGITCKIYDENDDEITTPGALGINLAACVKTVMDFEPAFDYEMIGGELRINSNPSSDVRLWIIGAPDISAQYGGSKEFASGVNLKFMAPDSSFSIDGRVAKYVTYSNVTHSGKLRVVLKHPAGTSLNIQVVIHAYKL